jgi:glycosyltransferase involved in cell wall biosynthesis
MKVAIELQPCLKNKSGIGIYTYEIAKRLSKCNKLQVTGDIFSFLNRNDVSKDIEGLDFHKDICSLFSYGVYKRIWHYTPIRYRQLFRRQTDITHFFNFLVPPRIDGKVINTIHDLSFLLYPETMDKRNLGFLKKNIQYSVDRPDKIITISENSKNEIIKHLQVDSNKIEIIYPGVDYHAYHTIHDQLSIDAVMNKYHLPKEYILYMGTLEPRKNIVGIVEAFSMLKRNTGVATKQVRLVLAGKKGWLYEPIFSKVQELGLEQEVVFTDYVEEKDKPIIYGQARAFVFPSLYEGFGIPVLEAMAASVPVITSNTSSLPEVVGDAGVLVDPMDTEAIAKAMYKLIQDEGYVKQLIKRGDSQAQKFTWEASAHKLYEVYQSIM